jgi:hypothetical protein
VPTEELVESAIQFCRTNKVDVPDDARIILGKAVQLRKVFQEFTLHKRETRGKWSKIIEKLKRWRSAQENANSPHINTVLWIALVDELTPERLQLHKTYIKSPHHLTFDIPEAPPRPNADGELQAESLAQLINELYETYLKNEGGAFR